MVHLAFEQSICEAEGKLKELRSLNCAGTLDFAEECSRLEAKIKRSLKQIYAHLTPYQKLQVARHPARPHTRDYVETLIEDFLPLAGDRCFGEDAAMLTGLGRFAGRTLMVIGQEKGDDTTSRIKHNFGMARPEGYRKSRRLMQLGARFGIPILCFIDTPGAYPGVEAEERGQALAIAQSIEISLGLPVPVVTVVIGEGGSGGAVALGCADVVIMLEHAVYSVISPEGCASILWRSADHAAEAAEALKITADDLLGLKVIDEIVPEPLGGAHRNPKQATELLRPVLERHLNLLCGEDLAALPARRRQKFLAMGRDLPHS